MRRSIIRAAAISAFVGLATLTVYEAEARGSRAGGGGGGGARASASTSMSRGGGGGGSGFSRSGSYSRPAGATASQRPSGSRANTGNVNTGNVNRGNVNTGNVNRGNVNTGNINTGNVNRGNINTGNINTGDVNIHRDVHIDNDLPGGYYGGWRDYPLARGVAIGAVAGITAAAIGSAYYALPPACSPYVWQTYTYYTCSGTYYRPQYQGDTVVYVVVAKPK